MSPVRVTVVGGVGLGNFPHSFKAFYVVCGRVAADRGARSGYTRRMVAQSQSPLVEMPLFPLASVLFPGGQLQLRIFEPRYLDLVRECTRHGTGFGVCLILRGQEVGGGAGSGRHDRTDQ